VCGIVGYVGHEIDRRCSRERVLRLSHRGPDDVGEVTVDLGEKIGWLGHTRLSIQDLSSAGHQPMRSQDGRWWLVYNGEIYNHQDLRKQLDVKFRGNSDTETLVELISRYGFMSAVAKLNGIFAFAALDVVSKDLYLARDPFGVKPMYYTYSSNRISFASEIRALDVSREVDACSLQTFLTLRYVPSPATMLRNVNRLEPGHVIRFNLQSASIATSSYVRNEPSSNRHRFRGTIDDAIGVYSRLVRRAVKRQLLADVPVGILLSGGVDSALIAALACAEGDPIGGFSVGFGEEHPECELQAARETAGFLGIPFRPVTVDQEDLWNALDASVGAIEEPLGTTSILPMWYLAERAARDVSVVLTGQGADEPWGGYGRYQAELIRRLAPSRQFWRLINSLLGKCATHNGIVERGLRSLAAPTLPLRIVEAHALFNSATREELLGNGDVGRAEADVERWLSLMSSNWTSAAEAMMAVDSRMNLADDLLLYGDKITMAHSLEARVPILDLDVVRFVESLPTNFRVRINRGKIVHKLTAETHLPHWITRRKKLGFQVPFSSWIRRQWKQRVGEVILGESAPLARLLNPAAVEAVWQAHQNYRADNGRQIFGLLTLAIWLEGL